jgi:hypothetical protein
MHLGLCTVKRKSFMDLFVQKEWKSRSELDPAYVVPYVLKKYMWETKAQTFIIGMSEWHATVPIHLAP